MTLPLLQIIPAGAGSGKTYKIQKELYRLISENLVSPERIVAVTFTEAAAGELSDRIRAELVGRRKIEAALKLDQAYISTIHSFGLRIITEFAFEAEQSPQPRLLNDDEKDILIRLALSRTSAADGIKDDLEAFGYKYEFNSGESPEEKFRSTIFGLIEKLRSIGSRERNNEVIEHALKKIKYHYGTTGDEAALNKGLLDAVNALLRTFPNNRSVTATGKKNRTALDELRMNFVAFTRARNRDYERDWALWQELRKLRISNKLVKLTQGYDTLAGNVMAAAEGLTSHPGPLRHALAHADGLLGASWEALSRYSEDKSSKGLVDYVDMVGIARHLLTKPAVLKELKRRIGCVVIDEFQDTNPLQFSLLWALQKEKIPTMIVGDVKQAIMGFQHADPRLLGALTQAYAGDTKPLDKNFRSSDELMGWINTIGKGLFNDSYQSLVPMAQIKSLMKPLEVIDFPEGPYKGKKNIPAQYVAMRIRDVLADEKQNIYLKEEKVNRRLRGGDIAVLCPTNTLIKKYAEALTALNIKTRLEQDGWFNSPIIQAAYHALAYAANPGDSHAALYLAVTELGNHDLEDALKKIVNNESVTESFLASLSAAGEAGDQMFVDQAVAGVISALDLYGVVSEWPDAEQARANLLRLQGEAHEFMSANREALASGGFYGTGLKTFLAWLVNKKAIDDSQPSARVVDEEAVLLTTWHKSKGREWPVVVVAATDYILKVRLPRFDIESEDNFKDLDRVLDNAKITMSPSFAAPEVSGRFSGLHTPEMESEAKRLLYVALTRAKEKIVLEWPRYRDAKNEAKIKKGEDANVTYWTILKDSTEMGLDVTGSQLQIGALKYDCIITSGGSNTPTEFEQELKIQRPPLPVIGRRAIQPKKMPEGLTPEAITPSSMHIEEPEKVKGLELHPYGDGLELSGGLAPMERGNILHRCFEVLPQRGLKIEVLRSAVGYALTEEEHANINKAVAAFEDFVRKHWAPIEISREIPILVLNDKGSVVSGVIDLLIETDKGFWIIDHKTDSEDDLEARFGRYLGQLQAYKEAVEKARDGKKVLGVGINWIKYGKVMMK